MSLGVVVAAFLAGSAVAPAASDCDRLAANPEDPDRIAAPVPQAKVDLPRAIAACEAAVARTPADARARYQLSRVLSYAGQSTRAVAEMKRAADDGYRQAQFVYGLIIERKRPGAPSDICVAEPYWLQSARAGRQAARISYVRHVVKGRFNACPIGASPAEMRDFLRQAASAAEGYSEKLLIDDLTEALEARKP
jgi:TPR repeat protein